MVRVVAHWQPAQRFLDISFRANRRRCHGALTSDPIGRQVRSAERDGHRESGSFSNGAIDLDCAFVEFDEFLHQGKADSAAFIGAALLPFDAMEALEQTREFVVRNTNAAVADAQLGLAVHLAQAHRDLAVESEFERVGEKIEYDLLPHVAIDIDGFRQRRTVDGEIQSRSLACRPKIAGNLAREFGKVGRFIDRLRTPRFNSGKIEQRIDQFEQAATNCDARPRSAPCSREVPCPRASRAILPVDSASRSAACGTRG